MTPLFFRIGSSVGCNPKRENRGVRKNSGNRLGEGVIHDEPRLHDIVEVRFLVRLGAARSRSEDARLELLENRLGTNPAPKKRPRKQAPSEDIVDRAARERRIAGVVKMSEID